MLQNIFNFKIYSLLILALAFLCGCKNDAEFNHWYKSGDSSFNRLDIKNSDIIGVKTVMTTYLDGYSNESQFFTFVMGVVYEEKGLFDVFDTFCSIWNFFPTIYLKDIDNDGENELVIIAKEELGFKVKNVINIYRHFPEAEFGEPHFLAIDKPIRFFSDNYEFEDGKLIIKNEGNYKDGSPIPSRVYKIERYKLVMESGDEDLRNEYFFLRPPRKEADWLELKKEYEKKSE